LYRIVSMLMRLG